jgi:Icc-related predicted phosphoesterase
MRDLRLLACSDIHGSKEAVAMLEEVSSRENYDAIVVCGDFTTMGSLDFVKDFVTGFKTRVLAVPGNCDYPDTVGVLEQANASVHNMRVELGGRSFFGFGGGVPTNSGMPFEVDESIIERSLRSIAVPDGIMVTHTPAYGMNDRFRSGGNGGSQGILRVAKEFKPVLALSGHVHESRGKMLTVETLFLNPGPARDGSYASVVVGDVAEAELHSVELKKGKPTMF